MNHTIWPLCLPLITSLDGLEVHPDWTMPWCLIPSWCWIKYLCTGRHIFFLSTCPCTDGHLFPLFLPLAGRNGTNVNLCWVPAAGSSEKMPCFHSSEITRWHQTQLDKSSIPSFTVPANVCYYHFAGSRYESMVPYSSFSVAMIKYPDLSNRGVKRFLLAYSSREGTAQHDWEGSMVAGAQG